MKKLIALSLFLTAASAFAGQYVFDRDGICRSLDKNERINYSYDAGYKKCKGQYKRDLDQNCRAVDYQGNIVYGYVVDEEVCKKLETKKL